MFGQSLYALFTNRAGMYLCYIVPIIYGATLVVNGMLSKRASQSRIRLGEFVTLAALLLLALDFGRFLYLFFSGHGKTLPPTDLLLKYVGGGILWVWVVVFIYQHRFTAQAAGEHRGARYLELLGVVLGMGIVGGIGIFIS
jgi:hypothetical protein